MDVKRRLTAELVAVVKASVRESGHDRSESLSSDSVAAVCNICEAIFIHGLKNVRASRFDAKKRGYPAPNFWPLLEKFTPRDIRAQIGNLNQIKTDIGRARVWIRIALNDGVLENYVTAIVADVQVIRHYYNQRAYLRDSDQCDIMLNYMRVLPKLTFKAPLNSSVLNDWTPTPLKLAGLFTDRPATDRHLNASLDMENITGHSDDDDVAVAMSALEFDGLEDPTLAIDSESVCESQVSLRSRPVAAYGERNLFSPDCGSFTDSLGSSILGEQRRNDWEKSYDSANDDNVKLDAILCALGGGPAKLVPITDHLANVASSPSTSATNEALAAARVDEDQTEKERSTRLQDQPPTSSEEETVAVEHLSDDLDECSPSASSPAKPFRSAALDQLADMSFSPGNSLAAQGWSSPTLNELPPRHSVSSASSSGGSDVDINKAQFASLFSNFIGAPETVGEPRRSSDTVVDDREVVDETTTAEVAANIDTDLRKSGSTDDVDDSNIKVQTHLSREHSPSSSSLDNYVMIEESQENQDQAAAQKSYRMSFLTTIAIESGLDTQDFKCHSCRRSIGLLFGSYHVCAYDGHYYCSECHLDDLKIVPARMLLNWDSTPRPISRASKAFLDSIADQPLINLSKVNPTLADTVEAVQDVQNLRLQLRYVSAYLLTCQESVAKDLRRRIEPKEYLYKENDSYSISDLLQISTGQMQKHLRSIIQYGVKHIQRTCRLCAQKGFICELCNTPEIIYAFQVDSTHRCPQCSSVYHRKCVASHKEFLCPKCVRRETYAKQSERGSMVLDSVLPLGV